MRVDTTRKEKDPATIRDLPIPGARYCQPSNRITLLKMNSIPIVDYDYIGLFQERLNII